MDWIMQLVLSINDKTVEDNINYFCFLLWVRDLQYKSKDMFVQKELDMFLSGEGGEGGEEEAST
jgi:hypothetical protein